MTLATQSSIISMLLKLVQRRFMGQSPTIRVSPVISGNARKGKFFFFQDSKLVEVNTWLLVAI